MEPLASLRDEDVDEFTHLVLEHELAVASAYIDVVRARGISAERVIMELLAPSARKLGQLWEDDLRDFLDVTIGLSRIQHLLHAVSPAFQSEIDKGAAKHSVLLAASPGEQHTLGLMIVEEFFRRSGWDCAGNVDAGLEEVVNIVAAQSFDVIGFSTSCEVLLGGTASAIEAVRKSSRNRKVIVMVGGPLFRADPDLVSRIGADACADDGSHALNKLNCLLAPNLSSLR
ncbi:MAG: cobalamin B12-binding domain-containing protein [Hyphomicrobiaceae bacterium]|nr:cobalamin B12-binding domain-containing protein [Hyphomicrobiaceae bacterium]